LRSIKPAEKDKRDIYYDAQIPGFGIRVTERSAGENIGAFVLVTRFEKGKSPTPRRIGDYPAMTLAKARQTARDWRELIAQGIDPKVKEAKQRREEDRRREETFTAVFEAFAEDHLSTLRTGAAVKKVVENHVFPKWGSRPISEIRRADVNELIRALRKDAPIGANRLLASLKTFFSWAIEQELIDASPAASIKRPSKEIKRDRVLSDMEICAIWQACGDLGAFGRAFKLMLATGQRRSEVGKMTWAEIDRKQMVWTLGRERTKADRAHEVPLSALAMSIIEKSPKLGDFIFSTGRSAPARAGGTAKPVAISGWSKAKSTLDKRARERLQALAVERGEDAPAKIADWHLHDLRRTAATHMARLGVDRVVIAKVLNHAENEVTAIYDRHRYGVEKRRALDLWGERLAAIVSGTDGGNVVSLPMRSAL
jgi:integrase